MCRALHITITQKGRDLEHNGHAGKKRPSHEIPRSAELPTLLVYDPWTV